jgi:hypothetical protein
VSQRDFDRRLDPRVADGIIQVEYVAPSPRVRDLSVSGLYLRDSRTLQRGQPIELKLRLSDGGEPILIQGMVRRVDPGEGMAIEFIQLSAQNRRRIKDFISRSDPGKVSPAGEDEF